MRMKVRRRQEPTAGGQLTLGKNSRALALAPAIRARKLSFFPNSVHSFVLYRRRDISTDLLFFFFPPIVTVPSFIDMKWRSFFSFFLSLSSSSYTLRYYSPIFLFCSSSCVCGSCYSLKEQSKGFWFYFLFFIPQNTLAVAVLLPLFLSPSSSFVGVFFSVVPGSRVTDGATWGLMARKKELLLISVRACKTGRRASVFSHAIRFSILFGLRVVRVLNSTETEQNNNRPQHLYNTFGWEFHTGPTVKYYIAGDFLSYYIRRSGIGSSKTDGKKVFQSLWLLRPTIARFLLRKKYRQFK